MRRAAVLGLSVSLLILALVTPALAQIYRYTDERGQNTYVDGLENVPERFRATAVPLGMRNAPAAPATAPAAGAPGKPSGAAVLKYAPGQPIMVDATINGGSTVKLLLDTGADRTLISPRALTAAGVTITKPVASGNITGATGTDRIDFVVVESLEVGDGPGHEDPRRLLRARGERRGRRPARPRLPRPVQRGNRRLQGRGPAGAQVVAR